MRIGQLVMLIGSDGFMPNLGAVGEVVAPFDGEDYGVMFDGWPCPVESPEWYVPPRWLMPIDPTLGRPAAHDWQAPSEPVRSAPPAVHVT